jgi:hypothetical protein
MLVLIGKSVRWIQNWLANRKQSVVIDGSTSDAVSVDSGVPQGSVLDLGLFLYYIHDLQSRLTSMSSTNSMSYIEGYDCLKKCSEHVI